MVNPSTEGILVIGSPSEAADCRYASGFVAVDPMVYLECGRKQHLVVPLLELGRARQESPRAKVYTPQELGLSLAKRRSLSAWAVALLRTAGVRRVVVSPMFPAGVLRALERDGVRVRIAEGPLFPRRAVKTPREVEAIRVSQKAAVAATNAAVRILDEASVKRDGTLAHGGRTLTSEALRAVIDRVLLDHGCMARDTIVAGGRQAADPHDRGHGPLRAGETIVLDIFPQHKGSGYWGDITRTVLKGEPTPVQARMYAAVLKAQKAALGMIRHGAACRAIHEAVQQSLEADGFTTSVRDGVARGFFHGTGHGVGLEIHESPSLSPNDGVLKAGHVVTVEPGLYYPEHGGVRIEDTVVVTRTGFAWLATCPKRFRLADAGRG